MTHLRAIYYPDKLLLQPFAHLSQKGSERNNILAKIWRAFNFWFNCPKEKRMQMAEILDDLLSVFYLMDDVLDDTALRRGFPTAQLIFGLPQTVFGTVYAVMEKFEKILRFEDDKEILSDAFIQMCLDILFNQCMIMYYRNNYICPTFEEYDKNLCCNSWLSFSIKLVQLSSKNKLTDITSSLVEKIGSFVQIYNDYLNVQSLKYSKMNCYCDDLTEGKFSFLVIHAVRTHPEDNRILNLMKKKPSDVESKNCYVNILKELGSLDFAKKTLKKMRDEIIEELEKLYFIKNPYIEKPFDDVLNNLESDGEIYCDAFQEED